MNRNHRSIIFEKSTKATVECLECKKSHSIYADSFITVYGDIMIGGYGGVVGGNFDEDGQLKRASIFCRTQCLQLLLNDPFCEGVTRKMNKRKNIIEDEE